MGSVSSGGVRRIEVEGPKLDPDTERRIERQNRATKRAEAVGQAVGATAVGGTVYGGIQAIDDVLTPDYDE